MSNYYPCAYYDNGKCQKFSDGTYNAWCEADICNDRVAPEYKGNMTVRDCMVEARLRRGMNRYHLSKASGVARTMIIKYETGESFPGLLNLWSLADALDITMDEYVGRVKKEKS